VIITPAQCAPLSVGEVRVILGDTRLTRDRAGLAALTSLLNAHRLELEVLRAWAKLYRPGESLSLAQRKHYTVGRIALDQLGRTGRLRERTWNYARAVAIRQAHDAALVEEALRDVERVPWPVDGIPDIALSVRIESCYVAFTSPRYRGSEVFPFLSCFMVVLDGPFEGNTLRGRVPRGVREAVKSERAADYVGHLARIRTGVHPPDRHDPFQAMARVAYTVKGPRRPTRGRPTLPPGHLAMMRREAAAAVLAPCEAERLAGYAHPRVLMSLESVLRWWRDRDRHYNRVGLWGTNLGNNVGDTPAERKQL
jgi:hypothetical protein